MLDTGNHEFSDPRGPERGLLNAEDYEIVFETACRRCHSDRDLAFARVRAILQGPHGEIGPVAKMTAWRYATGHFEFGMFDDDLYWILQAASPEAARVAAQVHKRKRSLVQRYDQAGWSHGVPHGLVVIGPVWAEPALRGSGIGPRLFREASGILRYTPHAVATTLFISEPEPPAGAGEAERRKARREHLRTVRRVARHFTGIPSTGLEQAVPAEPTLLTGYWTGELVLSVDEDLVDLTEWQVRELLARLS